MKDLLTRNWGLKLIAVALAVSLELYFISPQNLLTESLTAPVEVLNLPAELMIVSPPAASQGIFAEMKVRGPGPLIERVRSMNHKFTIRLPENIGNSYSTWLTGRQLELPPGVELLEVSPARLDLKFEKIVKKELVVVTESSGSPAPGLEVEEMKVSPSTVVAWGPESEMEGLNVIETAHVKVDGLLVGRIFEVPLQPRGPLTTLGVNVVSVDVKVAAKKAERIIESARVAVKGSNGLAATVQPSRVNLIFSGEQRLLDALDPKGIEALVDAGTLIPGEHDVSVTCDVPPGIKLVGALPQKVRVHVQKNNS